MAKQKDDQPAEKPQELHYIVEKHKRCPTCFGTRRGTGQRYAGSGLKRYYKCPECGMTWSVIFNAAGEIVNAAGDVIEPVQITSQQIGKLEER